MKKIISTVLILMSCTLAFSQDDEIITIIPEMTRYWQKAEPNKIDGQWNFETKTGVEKLFFGDFNAKVEFFLLPSFESSYGFRLIENADGSYAIEAMRIGNYDEVEASTSKKYPSFGVPAEVAFFVFSDEKLSQEIGRFNGEMWAKRSKERLELYRVDKTIAPVTDAFAEKLYTKIVSSIATAQDELKSKDILVDGMAVTFRCIVGDDLWTFKYHGPEGEFLQLTELCTRIVNDIEAGTFKESSYPWI